MTTLYRVKVIAKTATSVRLSVQCLDLDQQYIPEEPSFGLMLLHDAAQDGTPLRDAIGNNDILDKMWMMLYATGFVTRVVSGKFEHAPPKAAYSDYEHAYWKSRPAKLLRGECTITVTDPAWIAHLKAKSTWTSTAFALVDVYEDCKPFLHADELAPSGSGDAGFIPVPSTLWPLRGRIAPTPTVMLPAYGDGAYRVIHERTGPFTPKELAPYANRPVRATLGSRQETGVLLLGRKRFMIGTFGIGVHSGAGFHQGDYHELEKIGALELKRNARVATEIDFAAVMEKAPAHVLRVATKGATATFEIELAADGHAPVRTAEDALRVVATPCQKGGLGFRHDSPLGVALARASEEGDPIASCAHYVRSYKLTLPRKKPALPMPGDNARVKALLEAPRPMATLAVTMTEPGWLVHLANAKPYTFAYR